MFIKPSGKVHFPVLPVCTKGFCYKNNLHFPVEKCKLFPKSSPSSL